MLEVHNVSKWFGNRKSKVQAVRNVSFSIHPGEVLALVGESGSGKSTLAQLIMKLMKPESGTIRFEGREICASRPSKEDVRSIQIVFQNPDSSLNPRMTVEELLQEPLVIHRIPREARARKTKILMEQVRLPQELSTRRPRELSGGQKQRIAIARALALEPRLLIADEATSALDAVIEGQIMELLAELQRYSGFSMLLITHHLGLVRRFADRVAVMKQGELVELAETEPLFQSPQHPYTRQLLEAIPVSHPRDRV